MRNLLAIISGIISITATVPYIIDTLKGKTRPSLVTWFTWASLSAIAAIAALASHSVQTAIFAGSLALANYAIVISGLRHGVARYTKFDVICQLLAIAGIILWRVTDRPVVAVVFVIISDFVGALPTYRHIWYKPHEETLSSFVAYLVSDALVLLSLASYAFVASGYPVYITLSSASISGLILIRRRSLRRPFKATA